MGLNLAEDEINRTLPATSHHRAQACELATSIAIRRHKGDRDKLEIVEKKEGLLLE